MAHTQRITAVALVPEGEPLFSEMVTHVRIEDEAAGEFVVVSQSRASGEQSIQIDVSEWPALRDAITEMVALCRPSNLAE